MHCLVAWLTEESIFLKNKLEFKWDKLEDIFKT